MNVEGGFCMSILLPYTKKMTKVI